MTLRVRSAEGDGLATTPFFHLWPNDQSRRFSAKKISELLHLVITPPQTHTRPQLGYLLRSHPVKASRSPSVAEVKIMRMTRPLMSLAVVLGIVLPASAGAISVGDGNLLDWGINPGYNNTTSSSFTYSYSGSDSALFGGQTGTGTTGNGFIFNYHLEDSDDSKGHSFQLGPQYGGQDYDAEFLGAGIDGSNLAVGILSGQRADNGFSYFSPGDIRIEVLFGTVTSIFGIEVGAGGSKGATYDIKNDGRTDGVRYSDGSGSGTYTLGSMDAAQTAGTMWLTSAADWISNSPITPNLPVQFKGGTKIDDSLSPIQYGFSNISTQHSLIELLIPLGLFEGGTIKSLQWAPACGNDVLNVATNFDTIEYSTPSVPEPSTLALVGLGGFGMMFRQLRRKKTAA